WITTTGGVHINTMMEYRQQKPRLGLTKCPDLVDHYTLAGLVEDSMGEAMDWEGVRDAANPAALKASRSARIQR
ncbi:hypothetical protein ACK34P_18110, partial [Aeromonas veronii]